MNRVEAIREIELMLERERRSYRVSGAGREQDYEVSIHNLAVRRRVDALEKALEALRR